MANGVNADERLARAWLAAVRSPRPIATAIDARDPMWRAIEQQPAIAPELRRVDYLRAGHEAATALLGALGRARIDPAQARVLDFGCGYGRVTRHLVGRVAAVEACDVDPEAAWFVRDALGVDARVIDAEPNAQGRYDAVVCTSVLNHFPASRFDGWIDALAPAVAGGGALVFSTHDPASLPAVPTDGDYTFVRQPAGHGAGGDDYGTALVAPARVTERLRAAGFGSVDRRARGLWFFQDLWLATDRPLPRDVWRDPTAVRARFDRVRVDADDALVAEGWAASLDAGPITALELRRDAPDGPVVGHVETGLPSPGQAAFHGRADFAHAGWRATGAIDGPVDALWLVVPGSPAGTALDVRWLGRAAGCTAVSE